MKKTLVLVSLAIIALLTVGCVPVEDKSPKPTNQPTAGKTITGPIRPEDRPPKPAEGVDNIAGCPVNVGIIVDIYYGEITESISPDRVGQEGTFVLRWVNQRKHPSRDGGCWQQTAFTDPNAQDRLIDCNIEGQKSDGLNWPGCMRDG